MKLLIKLGSYLKYIAPFEDRFYSLLFKKLEPSVSRGSNFLRTFRGFFEFDKTIIHEFTIEKANVYFGSTLPSNLTTNSTWFRLMLLMIFVITYSWKQIYYDLELSIGGCISTLNHHAI